MATFFQLASESSASSACFACSAFACDELRITLTSRLAGWREAVDVDLVELLDLVVGDRRLGDDLLLELVAEQRQLDLLLDVLVG